MFVLMCSKFFFFTVFNMFHKYRNFFVRILTFLVNSTSKLIPMYKVTLNYENCIQIKNQLLVTAFIVTQMFFSLKRRSSCK